MKYIQGALIVSSVIFVTLTGGSISVHLNILFLSFYAMSGESSVPPGFKLHELYQAGFW